MNIINNDPFIAYQDNFITDEECKFMIDISKPHMKRAYVSDTSIDKNTYKGRTNNSHWIHLDTHELLKNLAKRIAGKIGIPSYKLFESFQIIHYTKDQEYKYHYDAYDKEDAEKMNIYCKDRGNRYMTVLCYINDVTKGGGTGFDSIEGRTEPLVIEPRKGRMVVFQNVHLDGSLHRQSRHAGLPVEEGEKWAFNLWVRERSIKN